MGSLVGRVGQNGVVGQKENDYFFFISAARWNNFCNSFGYCSLRMYKA